MKVLPKCIFILVRSMRRRRLNRRDTYFLKNACRGYTLRVFRRNTIGVAVATSAWSGCASPIAAILSTPIVVLADVANRNFPFPHLQSRGIVFLWRCGTYPEARQFQK